MKIKIEKWDSLKPWLPEDLGTGKPMDIFPEFLKSLGFGCNENGALDDVTREFIESCTSGLKEICPGRGYGNKVYALSFDEDPPSYPDVEKECGGRHSQPYYDMLGEALQACQDSVFEDSSPLEEYGNRFQDFLDHFGTYDRRPQVPPRRPRLNPNWHQFSQSSQIYLYSDWEAGFWDLSRETLDDSVWGQVGEDKFGYKSEWEAFQGQYLDLLGLAMFQWWFQIMIGPDEIMHRWRWDLGQHLGLAVEDGLYDLAELAVLNKILINYKVNCKAGYQPTDVMGWTDPKEFASLSNENCELVPGINAAVKALRGLIVDRISEALRREEDCVVVVTSGVPVTYKDNGRTETRIDVRKYVLDRLTRFPEAEFDVNHVLQKDPVLGPLARVLNDSARLGSTKESAEHFITMLAGITAGAKKET